MSIDLPFGERFGRTEGIFSPEVRRRLARAHVLIAGVGGSGGQLAVDLARLGVGFLSLADFDVYELSNMNRQVGCFESTLGCSKIKVVGELLTDINPEIGVRYYPEGIQAEGLDEILAPTDFPPVDFVAELIDIADLEAKVHLHRRCRERGTTIMTAVMLGMGAALHVFGPESPGYDELFLRRDGRLSLERIVPGLGSYIDREVLNRCAEGKGHSPSCAIGATLASGLMAAEIVRGLREGPSGLRCFPEYTYVDFLDGVFRQGRLDT